VCLTSCALAQTFETAVISAVYAVGLYVDPKAAKKLLSSKQADISAVQGIPEQAVFDGAHTHWLQANQPHCTDVPGLSKKCCY